MYYKLADIDCVYHGETCRAGLNQPYSVTQSYVIKTGQCYGSGGSGLVGAQNLQPHEAALYAVLAKSSTCSGMACPPYQTRALSYPGGSVKISHVILARNNVTGFVVTGYQINSDGQNTYRLTVEMERATTVDGAPNILMSGEGSYVRVDSLSSYPADDVNNVTLPNIVAYKTSSALAPINGLVKNSQRISITGLTPFAPAVFNSLAGTLNNIAVGPFMIGGLLCERVTYNVVPGAYVENGLIYASTSWIYCVKLDCVTVTWSLDNPQSEATEVIAYTADGEVPIDATVYSGATPPQNAPGGIRVVRTAPFGQWGIFP